MQLAEHIADHERLGCTNKSDSLGIQKMPPGYALMLDADNMYFYWLRHDGKESDISWDKWAIYHWACDHFKAGI